MGAPAVAVWGPKLKDGVGALCKNAGASAVAVAGAKLNPKDGWAKGFDGALWGNVGAPAVAVGGPKLKEGLGAPWPKVGAAVLVGMPAKVAAAAPKLKEDEAAAVEAGGGWLKQNGGLAAPSPDAPAVVLPLFAGGSLLSALAFDFPLPVGALPFALTLPLPPLAAADDFFLPFGAAVSSSAILGGGGLRLRGGMVTTVCWQRGLVGLSAMSTQKCDPVPAAGRAAGPTRCQ